jgi:hypothetical protein
LIHFDSILKERERPKGVQGVSLLEVGIPLAKMQMGSNVFESISYPAFFFCQKRPFF